MLSMILGSVLPFIAKGVKTYSDAKQDKRDKAHELALSKQEWEFRKEIESEKTQQVAIEEYTGFIESSNDFAKVTSKATGITWVDAIISLVRPVITYVIFAMYVYLIITLAVFMEDQRTLTPETIINLWQVMCAEIFTFIISYWFGERGARRIFDRKIK